MKPNFSPYRRLHARLGNSPLALFHLGNVSRAKACHGVPRAERACAKAGLARFRPMFTGVLHHFHLLCHPHFPIVGGWQCFLRCRWYIFPPIFYLLPHAYIIGGGGTMAQYKDMPTNIGRKRARGGGWHRVGTYGTGLAHRAFPSASEWVVFSPQTPKCAKTA